MGSPTWRKSAHRSVPVSGSTVPARASADDCREVPSETFHAGLRAWLRTGRASVRALPVAARAWWTGTLLLAVLLVPAYLPQVPSRAPWPALLLVGALNFLLVRATGPRRSRDALAPSFDYGGIATVALLASFGPAAACCAFIGEK